jgi:transposase InsO family protein
VTYIWIADQFWYLSTVIIDAATKELLGWSFADHMRTELVTNALNAAVKRRGTAASTGGCTDSLHVYSEYVKHVLY